MSEKIKIKQSELNDIYDIEDDKVKETKESKGKEQDYEITIKEEDEKLEEEVNDGIW